MTPLATFGAAALGTAAVAGGVILALRRSLHAVLVELCVLEHRARFWQRACSVELAAGVALAATVGASTTTSAHGALAAAAAVARWELAGATAGLVVIAAVVAREGARGARYGPPRCAPADGGRPSSQS